MVCFLGFMGDTVHHLHGFLPFLYDGGRGGVYCRKNNTFHL